jgi:tRNA(adenine34) deaminase
VQETAPWSMQDEAWMRLALQEAARAAAAGEVPVGAVLVRGDEVLAAAHNLREALRDPTAHAEMLAIRRAAELLGDWRLEGTTMYVTLEPCPMCAGALWLARVGRLVYGAADERAGAAGTLYNVVADPRLNHRLRVDAGLLADEARALLQHFFRKLREERRAGADRGEAPGGGRRAEGCPSG